MKNHLLLFASLITGGFVQAQCGSSDLTPPTAVCQNITVYLDGAGNATITPTDIDGGSTDNCPGISFFSSQSSFTCSNVGGNSVTLTVADANGNIASCNATVTVADTTSPYMICPGDQTETPTAPCNFTLPSYTSLVSPVDNCGGISISQTPPAGTVINGTTAVTLTASDFSGNATSCTFDVILNDVTNPTAVCQSATAYLDLSGNVTITPAAVDGGSSDNCSGYSLALSQANFNCSDLGANNVTLTITDNSGNSDNCGAVVTVLDTISPSLNCPTDITVCKGEIVTYTVPMASDNCSETTSQTDASGLSSGMVFSVGTTTLEYTSTDGSGNTAVCSFDVVVLEIDTSVTVSSATLTANQSGANYQWINCNGMTTINGENNQSFTAGTNGDYAVAISLNGCSDTSFCYTISGVGIIENGFGEGLRLYPNPTSGLFSIDLGDVYPEIKITIKDLNGKLIVSETYEKSQVLNLDFENPVGIYVLEIESGGKRSVIRLVKE